MLNPAELHATCRPFAEARTLPAAVYTSPAVLATLYEVFCSKTSRASLRRLGAKPA